MGVVGAISSVAGIARAAPPSAVAAAARPAHLPACAPRLPRRGAPAAARRATRAAAGGGGAAAAPPPPSTAAAAVEAGLEKFASGDAAGALDLFLAAQRLSPDADEARAAAFNAACAYCRLGRFRESADAVLSAVNDHGLRLAVAAADPDLAALRERREWQDVVSAAAGGLSDAALARLRAEARAPFRLPRTFLLGGLTAGAGLGFVILAIRLAAALRGGDGAPELAETAQNTAINAACLAVFGFFLKRDLDGKARDEDAAAREEALGRLQVELRPGRPVPLFSLRGAARPVVLAGSRGQVAKAAAAAAGYKADLRARGVCIVAVVLSEDDPAAELRRLKAELAGGEPSKGFGGKAAAAKAGAASGGEPEADAGAAAAERKWQLEPADRGEWREWVQAQPAVASAAAGQGAYFQVQLDGTVRASGVGAPPWRRFLDDLPPLDDPRTKITDGKAFN